MGQKLRLGGWRWHRVGAGLVRWTPQTLPSPLRSRWGQERLLHKPDSLGEPPLETGHSGAREELRPKVIFPECPGCGQRAGAPMPPPHPAPGQEERQAGHLQPFSLVVSPHLLRLVTVSLCLVFRFPEPGDNPLWISSPYSLSPSLLNYHHQPNLHRVVFFLSRDGVSQERHRELSDP